MTDITKCPKCGGPADNGFDRCYPPNPYYCTKCEETDREAELLAVIRDLAAAARAPEGKQWNALDKHAAIIKQAGGDR